MTTYAGPPARNEVAACVAAEMLRGLGDFARHGFAPFAAAWSALDSLRDAPVSVLRHDDRLQGTARGADVDGALLVDTGADVVRVHAGEVSLRRASPAGNAA